MFGLRLIFILAIVGGLIAFIGDKLGTKIGKKRLSIFGLRPKHTSILITVVTGVLIAATTILVMALSSNSARTAMFGMEKIQQELRLLNAENDIAAKKLKSSHEALAVKNDKISALDAEIEAINNEKKLLKEQVDKAQAEVSSLHKAKKELESEITELEDLTTRLRRGIVAMREGHIVYRTGEVIYAGVLKGGLQNKENAKQLDVFLNNANEVAMHRIGVKSKEPIRVIWLPAEAVDAALREIQGSKDNMFVRLRAVANVIAGEPMVCAIELAHNERIYMAGELIHQEVIDVESLQHGLDTEILNFLTEVNHKAVSAGVIPDPLTGKVGNLDATSMVQTSEKMMDLGGKVTLSAYAKGNINTSGPVFVKLEAKRYVEK